MTRYKYTAQVSYMWWEYGVCTRLQEKCVWTEKEFLLQCNAVAKATEIGAWLCGVNSVDVTVHHIHVEEVVISTNNKTIAAYDNVPVEPPTPPSPQYFRRVNFWAWGLSSIIYRVDGDGRVFWKDTCGPTPHDWLASDSHCVYQSPDDIVQGVMRGELHRVECPSDYI